MSNAWSCVAAMSLSVGAIAGCRTAAGACEDFIDAVEECQGAPDDHYNQDWCDETVDAGCEDRRYFDCLEDNLECNDGDASTTPIICQIKADVVCPD